jgi:hypothetical protein
VIIWLVDAANVAKVFSIVFFDALWVPVGVDIVEEICDQ